MEKRLIGLWTGRQEFLRPEYRQYTKPEQDPLGINIPLVAVEIHTVDEECGFTITFKDWDTAIGKMFDGWGKPRPKWKQKLFKIKYAIIDKFRIKKKYPFNNDILNREAAFNWAMCMILDEDTDIYKEHLFKARTLSDVVAGDNRKKNQFFVNYAYMDSGIQNVYCRLNHPFQSFQHQIHSWMEGPFKPIEKLGYEKEFDLYHETKNKLKADVMRFEYKYVDKRAAKKRLVLGKKALKVMDAVVKKRIKKIKKEDFKFDKELEKRWARVRKIEKKYLPKRTATGRIKKC